MPGDLLQTLLKNKDGNVPPEKKTMTKIAPFVAGKLPKRQMAQFTTEVNGLIEEYNNEVDESGKKRILEKIQAKVQEVNYRYPPNYLANSPEYNAIQASLFKQIQYQFASLGSPSLITFTEKQSPVSELLANMSPEKADQLLGILIKGKNANLEHEFGKLYLPNDQSSEAKAFRNFLSNHEISFLGGGNSKNFKVTCLSDNNVSVLKVDCRLNMPRHVEAHLRGKISEHFAPIHAERQATCSVSGGKKVSRTLLVTEFCAGGSVDEHRKKNRYVSDLEKNTGKIFEQMSKVLLQIQEAGCMFPDAKITNWLVDENNTIRLADTKSFLFTDEKGVYDSRIPGNEYCGLVTTYDFKPPKLEHESFTADSVHAFILGKNLYAYVTGDIPFGEDAADFNFNFQLFKTEMGREYKALIEGLVKPDPSQRMTVREAVNRFFLINNPEFKAVFTNLRALKFGENDEKMNEFIRNKLEQIKSSTPEQRKTILEGLKNTVSELKADKASEEIRTIIGDFRERSGLFTMGMNAKADRIEKSMSSISIEDRCHFLASKQSNEVMKVIASHRSWGNSGKTYLTRENEIDENKAAQSFKNFKQQFKAQMDEVKETPQQNKTSEEDNKTGHKI